MAKKYTTRSSSNRRAVPVRFDEETYDAVASVSGTLGVSMNSFVNDAVASYLSTTAVDLLSSARADAVEQEEMYQATIDRLAGKDTP